MNRAEALGHLTLLVVSGLSYLGGFLLVISGLYFTIAFGWLLLAIDPTSPFDDGHFGRTALRLLGATVGVGVGVLLIVYAKFEFKRIRGKVETHKAERHGS